MDKNIDIEDSSEVCIISEGKNKGPEPELIDLTDPVPDSSSQQHSTPTEPASFSSEELKNKLNSSGLKKYALLKIRNVPENIQSEELKNISKNYGGTICSMYLLKKKRTALVKIEIEPEDLKKEIFLDKSITKEKEEMKPVNTIPENPEKITLPPENKAKMRVLVSKLDQNLIETFKEEIQRGYKESGFLIDTKKREIIFTIDTKIEAQKIVNRFDKNYYKNSSTALNVKILHNTETNDNIMKVRSEVNLEHINKVENKNQPLPTIPLGHVLYISQFPKETTAEEIKSLLNQFGKVLNVQKTMDLAIARMNDFGCMKRAVYSLNGQFFKGFPLKVQESFQQNEKSTTIDNFKSLIYAGRYSQTPSFKKYFQNLGVTVTRVENIIDWRHVIAHFPSKKDYDKALALTGLDIQGNKLGIFPLNDMPLDYIKAKQLIKRQGTDGNWNHWITSKLIVYQIPEKWNSENVIQFFEGFGKIVLVEKLSNKNYCLHIDSVVEAKQIINIFNGSSILADDDKNYDEIVQIKVTWFNQEMIDFNLNKVLAKRSKLKMNNISSFWSSYKIKEQLRNYGIPLEVKLYRAKGEKFAEIVIVLSDPMLAVKYICSDSEFRSNKMRTWIIEKDYDEYTRKSNHISLKEIGPKEPINKRQKLMTPAAENNYNYGKVIEQVGQGYTNANQDNTMPNIFLNSFNPYLSHDWISNQNQQTNYWQNQFQSIPVASIPQPFVNPAFLQQEIISQIQNYYKASQATNSQQIPYFKSTFKPISLEEEIGVNKTCEPTLLMNSPTSTEADLSQNSQNRLVPIESFSAPESMNNSQTNQNEDNEDELFTRRDGSSFSLREINCKTSVPVGTIHQTTTTYTVVSQDSIHIESSMNNNKNKLNLNILKDLPLINSSLQNSNCNNQLKVQSSAQNKSLKNFSRYFNAI